MSQPRHSEPAESHPLLNPATIMIVAALCLTALGLTILFSASAWFKQGPYFYLNKQIMGVLGAAAVGFVVSRINLDYARRYAWWIAAILGLLLVLVLIPHIGISVKGSSRWLGYGSVRLQISEFAKVGLVFCLAHYLALNQSRIGELKCGYLYPLGMIFGFAGLVVLEPDYGTAALMIAVGIILLFLAGAKWRYIIPTVIAVVGGFTVLVILHPNRLRRMLEYLSEQKSYQLNQALVAYAMGGVEGLGLGQGRQQLSYLPEAHTDFIFSVIGEELGLVFTMGVVVLFTTILVCGLLHLRRAPNLFHFLLVGGCVLLISIQAIINIGVVTGAFPTKGMSLPFISAGLSNLLLMGILLGVIWNTHRTWGRAALPVRAGSLREVLT